MFVGYRTTDFISKYDLCNDFTMGNKHMKRAEHKACDFVV